jgi:hypothetical protein
MALLFAASSAGFLIAPFPGNASLVGRADVTTYRAMHAALGHVTFHKLVWRPDTIATCFLISGAVAYRASARHGWGPGPSPFGMVGAGDTPRHINCRRWFTGPATTTLLMPHVIQIRRRRSMSRHVTRRDSQAIVVKSVSRGSHARVAGRGRDERQHERRLCSRTMWDLCGVPRF